MKKYLKILAIASLLLLLISCGKKEISSVDFMSGKHPNYTGYVIDYYENGKMEGKAKIKNGLPHGEVITYYKNGSVAYKANFKSGVIDGKSIMYDEDGKVTFEQTFKDGVPIQ